MVTSLAILKKKFQIYHLYPKRFHTVLKLQKNARGLCFAYDTKMVAMVTSLEKSEKTGPDEENSRIYLSFDKKIVKIGPVDTELALLIF